MSVETDGFKWQCIEIEMPIGGVEMPCRASPPYRRRTPTPTPCDAVLGVPWRGCASSVIIAIIVPTSNPIHWTLQTTVDHLLITLHRGMRSSDDCVDKAMLAST